MLVGTESNRANYFTIKRSHAIGCLSIFKQFGFLEICIENRKKALSRQKMLKVSIDSFSNDLFSQSTRISFAQDRHSNISRTISVFFLSLLTRARKSVNHLCSIIIIGNHIQTLPFSEAITLIPGDISLPKAAENKLNNVFAFEHAFQQLYTERQIEFAPSVD